MDCNTSNLILNIFRLDEYVSKEPVFGLEDSNPQCQRCVMLWLRSSCAAIA